MKRCSTCNADYPDDAKFCRFDGGALVAAAAASAPQPGALTMGWDVQPEPAKPAAPQPGALTMGWDVQPEPAAAQGNAPSVAALAAQAGRVTVGPNLQPQTAKPVAAPSALTMGWDAQPEPAGQPPHGSPSASSQATKAAAPQPGALTMGWDAQPEPANAPAYSAPSANPSTSAPQAGSVTMGWDAQPPPKSAQPGSVTMGWDAQPEASAPTSASAPITNPARTMLGMQAPWAKPAAPRVAARAPDSSLPAAPPSVIIDAQLEANVVASAAPAEPEPAPPVQHQQQQPIAQAQQVPHASPGFAPHIVQAPSLSATSNTSPAAAATNTDGLDVPPKNRLPIYAALVALIVIAVAVAIFAL